MTAIEPATPDRLALAARLLGEGRLVAFPTETVYGLGADARSDEAVAKIYAAKERPRFNPLIAHVDSLAAAERQGQFSAGASALAAAFWPGPLTLVVPVAPSCSVSLLARAGLDSVALRVPSHPVARALLRMAAMPVAAPSANRSGRVSPTTAEHVRTDLEGRVDLILDGGACAVGLESTILSCLGPIEMLRPGGVSREAIEAVLGHPVATRAARDTALVAPGMLASHYAPRAAVRLDAREVGDDDAVLDFGGALHARRSAGPYRDLSARGDTTEAAANLFALLRELDRSGAARIVVAPIPDSDLGEALNDRLRRAAAPRP